MITENKYNNWVKKQYKYYQSGLVWSNFICFLVFIIFGKLTNKTINQHLYHSGVEGLRRRVRIEISGGGGWKLLYFTIIC